MMTVLTRYSMSGVLKNRTLWSWAIGFMLLWLLIGAFGSSQPTSKTVEGLTVASWFAIIALFGLSFIATNIARTISYATSSLNYGFRFTKLTPKSYVAALICCSSVLGAILIVVALGMSYGLFSVSYGTSMAPSNPIWALIVSGSGRVFMMAFAIMLVLVATNYLGLRSANLIIFLPLIVVAALSQMQMGSIVPVGAIYASPFNSIMSLLYNSYSGTTVYATLQLREHCAGSWVSAFFGYPLDRWIALCRSHTLEKGKARPS